MKLVREEDGQSTNAPHALNYDDGVRVRQVDGMWRFEERSNCVDYFHPLQFIAVANLDFDSKLAMKRQAHEQHSGHSDDGGCADEARVGEQGHIL